MVGVYEENGDIESDAHLVSAEDVQVQPWSSQHHRGHSGSTGHFDRLVVQQRLDATRNEIHAPGDATPAERHAIAGHGSGVVITTRNLTNILFGLQQTMEIEVEVRIEVRVRVEVKQQRYR